MKTAVMREVMPYAKYINHWQQSSFGQPMHGLLPLFQQLSNKGLDYFWE